MAGTALLGAGGTARASVTSDQLCIGDGTGGGEPTDAALIDAAERIEQSVGTSGSVSERDLSFSDSGATRPAAAALARFCAAAGEAMRVSPDGSQRQAQLYLRTALRESRAARLPELTALTAYRLGVVAVSGGSGGTGLRGSGEPIRRSGGETVRRLRAAEAEDRGSGEVCSALNGFDEHSAADMSYSMLALDCAGRLALDAGKPDISALASLRFARFALGWMESSDDPQALLEVARDRALAAIPIAATVSDPALRTELIARLARTALDLDPHAADRLGGVPQLLLARNAADPLAREASLEIEARVALARGDKLRAKAALEDAVLLENARAVPVMLPELMLLLAAADPARGQENVSAAYAALENIRPRLPRLDPLTEESMFALHMKRVFEAAADAQLNGTSEQVSARRIATAQRIVEAFREAELQSAIGSECLQSRTSVDLADLRPNEVLLYPLLFDDRVELIVVKGARDGTTARFERLPPNRQANRAEVAKLVETLVAELTTNTGDGWKKSSRALYDMLIEPIEGDLEKGSTLAIIPDGPLRAAPFAALLSGDGHYLVERTALSVAPALAYSQPGNEQPGNHLRIVAASLSKKVVLPAGSFSALSGTATEAKIAAQNGDPGTLVPNFTRKQLETALTNGEVNVLHLATHAAFNGRSDRAFIVANDEVIRLSELRDMLTDNRVRGDALGLLVLSACETAVGDDEASMGLAGAAVQAGASSAIASLWQVDDSGTAELMRKFYANLRAGESRSHAMQQAQVAMIKSGGPLADPFVWSAFTLLGAWR